MKRTLLVAALLLLPASFGGGSDAAGRAFMEVEGTLERIPSESRSVRFRIAHVRRLAGSTPEQPAPRLEVRCPIEIQPWTRVFAVGDTLSLEWQVQAKASRGWLFWGGRPERATLRAPSDGVSIACSCTDKRSTRSAPVFVAFVNPDGSTSSEIQLTGGSEFPLLRLLPLWHGGRARSRGTIRLRCGWDPHSVGLDPTRRVEANR